MNDTKPAGTDCETSCTLPPVELTERLHELRTGLLSQVVRSKEVGDGVELAFAASAERRTELHEFIAFEAQCCGFMSCAIRDDEKAGLIWLEITGSPGMRAQLSAWFPEWTPAARADDRRVPLIRAAAAAAVTALVALVCCATPLLATTLALIGLAGLTVPVAIAIDTLAPAVLLIAAVVAAAAVRARRADRRRARAGGCATACRD
jgi:hypothetical protein